MRSSCQSADIPLKYLHFPENTSVAFSLLLKNSVQDLMQFSEYACNLATSFVGGHRSLFLFSVFVIPELSGASRVFVCRQMIDSRSSSLLLTTVEFPKPRQKTS